MKNERLTHQVKTIGQHTISKAKSWKLKSLLMAIGIMALSGAVSADSEFSTPKGVPEGVMPQHQMAKVNGKTFHVPWVARSTCESSCSAVATSPRSIVAKAKATVAKSGAEFTGNTSSGRFSGKGVSGVYEIRPGIVIVTITNKPIFVPWAFVESKIRDFFG